MRRGIASAASAAKTITTIRPVFEFEACGVALLTVDVPGAAAVGVDGGEENDGEVASVGVEVFGDDEDSGSENALSWSARTSGVN